MRIVILADKMRKLKQFWMQYHSIKSYLINNTPPPERERLQSPEEREQLNGLYECILCAWCERVARQASGRCILPPAQ